MAEFPLVGQPDVEVAHGPGRKVHEELRQVELGIDLVAAAGGGQTRQDGGGAAAARRSLFSPLPPPAHLCYYTQRRK